VADLVITVPEPTDTSDGLTVVFRRTEGNAEIVLSYERNNVMRTVLLKPSNFTATQRNNIQAVMAMIVNVGKAAMGF
jgi:hypothetical protein